LTLAVDSATELITTSRGLTLECESADEVITKALRETGEWEEGVALAIEKHLEPGWTFLDVGAHIGYFATLAASKGAKVIAIEPDAKYAAMLRANLRRNILDGAVLEIAVSDSDGFGSLRQDHRFAGNPGAQYLTESPRELPILTLPNTIGDIRPEFLKVDIEGLEYKTLKAAPEILDHAKVIVVEVGREMCRRYGGQINDVVELLQEHGFGVTFIDGTPLDERFSNMQPDNYANLLAVKGAEMGAIPVAARASVILCAWRGLLAETAECMLMLRDRGWGYSIKRGDALITRSRSVAVSSWYRRQPDEDVFLMIDDDVVFLPEHAESVVKLAREKKTVVCGAYPVKDGKHLACRRFPGQQIAFGPNTEPVEVVYPATGFMAVHRDVITAMIEARTPEGTTHFPLCGDGDTAFWPFFDTFWITGEDGKSDYLSEDYAFGEVARRLGFNTWLDTTVVLYHMGYYPYSLENMQGFIQEEPK
jgi:FkbM family methyltransferase